MARAKQNKLYRTFVKGVITEAGFLTYPEDASTDELNTIISRKGNRSRRLGIDYEDGYVFEDLGVNAGECVNEFIWKSANNDPNVNFACVQVGSKISFYTMNDEPISSQKKSFEIDLADYKIPSAPMSTLSNEYVAFSAGMGFLFIAHKYIDPISIEYKPTNDTLLVVPMVIQIRDLEGVYDGLANDEEPYNLTPQHQYNLQNQGWVAPGTKTPNISTPSYPGTVDAPTPGNVYYDPYTGDTSGYDSTGGDDFNLRPDPSFGA